MRFKGLVILLSIGVAAPAFAEGSVCDANAFKAVLADASAAITRQQEANAQAVQAKLQALRAANNWSDEAYPAQATPFVKDDTTAALDASNLALLAKVQAFDAKGADSEAGRCAMLIEFRLTMDEVVRNTAARWRHILAKLDAATSTTTVMQAGIAR